MAEYLTTRELATYLRLNEKKVYALIAEHQLPATRVCGKWLFPKHLIDKWLEENTVYPTTGLMAAALDDMLILQGSDDWLLARAAERFAACGGVPVVSATVGSLAGLAALGHGRAHLAGCHVDNTQVQRLAAGGKGCYIVSLVTRSQGLLFDRGRNRHITGLDSVPEQGLRFAERQPMSGTYRLAERLFEQAGATADQLERVGPFASHVELALAIRRNEADVGIGTQLAAELVGLDYLELTTEVYKLAVPVAYASNPHVARFLEFVLDDFKAASVTGPAGYRFDQLGRIETVGGASEQQAASGRQRAEGGEWQTAGAGQ